MANTNPEEKYYNKLGPDLNRDFLVRDQSFLADARKFLGERKDYSLRELRDPEEVYKLFIRHMRHANSNELAAVNDLRHINDLDDAGKAQVGKLYSVWDRMDPESSVLDAIRDYGGGIITAPSTYLSVITAGAGKLVGATGAVAARMAAREAALGALKKTIANQQLNIARALPTNLAARRALTGAAGAGTVEGAIGATIGGAGEAVRTRADITGEREFRVSQPILHGLLGVTGGAVLGGAVGAVTGRRQMAALGLIGEANQALAAKAAEAEKNVTKVIYGFDKEVPISDKAVQENEALYIIAVNQSRAALNREALDPIKVAEGMRLKRDLLRAQTDEIPFPKIEWDNPRKGVYKTAIEGMILPRGKETQVFSEIVRSGPRQYTVSTGTEATDLLPASQTFETLKEAKAAVPGIVRERNLLPSIADEFVLTTEQFADSIPSKIAGMVVDIVGMAKAYKIIDKDTLLDLSTELPKDIKGIEVENLLNKRFTTIMDELLQRATKEQKQNFVGDLLDKYNLTLDQLTTMYMADLSFAGKLLGGQSALARSVMRQFTESVKHIQDIRVPVIRKDFLRSAFTL